MDTRRILSLLLVICTINAAFSIRNGGRPNNIRRVRRISEYLVPPPPPRFHPPDRIPRVANYQSTEDPGYMTRLMNWLKPGPLKPPTTAYIGPPPMHYAELPSLPPVNYAELSRPPPANYAKLPGPSTVYKKPLLPPLPNDNSGYPASTKTEKCTPCNTAPWTPIEQNQQTFSSLRDSPQIGGYKSTNHEKSPDTYSAASHEIRVPDFSFSSQSTGGQDTFSSLRDSPQIGGYKSTNHEKSPDTYSAASHEIRVPNFSFSSQSTGGRDTFSSLRDSPQIGGYKSINHGEPHADTYSAASHEIRMPDFSHPPQSIGGQSSSLIYPLPNPLVYVGAMPPIYKAKDFKYPSQVTPDENSRYFGTTTVSEKRSPTRDNSPLTGPAFNDGHNGQSVYSDSDLSATGVVSQGSGYTNPTNGGRFHQYLMTIDSTKSIPDKQGLKGTSNDSPFDSTSHQEFFGHGIMNDQSLEQSAAGEELYYVTEPNRERPNDFLDASQANQNPPSYGISNFDKIPNYYDHMHNSHGSLQTYDESVNGTVKKLVTFTSSLQNLLLSDKNQTHSFPIPPTSDAFANFKNATGILPPDDTEETLNYVNTDVTSEQQDGKRKQVQVIIPYTSDYTPLPFHPSYEKNISDVDNYIGEESRNTVNVIRPPNSPIFQPQQTTLQPNSSIFNVNRKPVPIKANNSIDLHKLQRNIDNWTIQKYSEGTTVSTVSPIQWNKPYLFPSKTIPKDYFTTTEPIDHVTNSYNDNVKTFTLAGFSFNDEEYNGSASHQIEGPRIQVIEKIENSTKSPIDAPITEKDTWQNFPVGISSANKERVYIVTPQPQSTLRPYFENRKQKAENNTKESKEDIKKMNTNKSDTFESIEKAYQVLPQAVNNLAVASTGPESVPLWGIMEHEDFASSVETVDNEYDSNDSTKLPMYSRLSKESRARR